jgi:hypothetical protein
MRNNAGVDRRFQVFVSSTFLDLKDERAAIVSALLQMDAFPAGMELFPAADDDAWTLIERVIEASDYYLLVIGGKYGSVDPETELSYTEREYDLAVSLGKPVMAFLHGEPQKIELGKSEVEEGIRKKLEAFRAKVQKSKHVKYWTNPDDLAGKVALSYAAFRQTYPAVGWVKGDVQTSAEALTELNELRKQLEGAETRLAAARTGPPPGTDRLSQGDDQVAFELGGSVAIQVASEPYTWNTVSTPIEATLSWDELFSTVGPLLLDESTQQAVEDAIDNWLTAKYAGQARRQAREWAQEQKLGAVTGTRKTKVWISSDDFGTILVQLRALGLITKSDRKRSVKDVGTYWTLTPYGDTLLTTLRAISRDPQPTDQSEDDEGDEESETGSAEATKE